jgi:hypothetical protein
VISLDTVRMHVHLNTESVSHSGMNVMAGWDEQVVELEADFPGWHVWRSNAGRWWATRTGAVLRREDLGTGRVMTVDADDVGSLRNLLLAQSRLDREVSGLGSGKEILNRI